MRAMAAKLGLGLVLGSALSGAVLAAEAVKATLIGHAVLPAMSFLPPPVEAGTGFVVSGRFAAIANRRVEEIASVEGKSFLDGRTTGIALPFVGQPVQGFSGIETLARDRYRVLVDNGFGNKVNSPDALLSFHEVSIDWPSGRVRIDKSVFLHDPDKVIPFRITNEFTKERYLTGADLDVESIQTIGDLHWLGDEFGPYLLAVDRTGKVVAFFETEVDGKVVRSPDHHAVSMPATPVRSASRCVARAALRGWRRRRTAGSSTRCWKARSMWAIRPRWRRWAARKCCASSNSMFKRANGPGAAGATRSRSPATTLAIST